MLRRFPRSHTWAALALAAALLAPSASAQPSAGAVAIAPRSIADLRDWTARVDLMQRTGDLRLRKATDDELVDGRIHERSDQYYKGVRVFGGDVARQIDNGL